MDILIKDHEMLIGSISIDTYRRCLEIDMISVATQFQSRGYGTLLLKMACEYADHNKKDIELIVGSGGPMSNLQLMRWYEKFGFKGSVNLMRRAYVETKENDNVEQEGIPHQISGRTLGSL